MKKLFYSLAVLFFCTLAANAQKEIIGGKHLNSVPSFFTYDHNPHLLARHSSYDEESESVSTSINIYDKSLNNVESVNMSGSFSNLELDVCLDKNGLRYYVDNLYLTQTFFNDDSDWEYIEPVYGIETVVSYTIKKTNGTVVGSIPANKWTRSVCVIDDVVYTKLEGEDDTYYYYTLPEFRKLISNDPSSVEPVPAMVCSVANEAHDLMGRKASGHHKGIVIKDGKKMINK